MTLVAAETLRISRTAGATGPAQRFDQDTQAAENMVLTFHEGVTAGLLYLTQPFQLVAWEGTAVKPDPLAAGGAFFDAHRAELRHKYPKMHVAIVNDTVVDSDKDLWALAERVLQKFGREQAFIGYTDWPDVLQARSPRWPRRTR